MTVTGAPLSVVTWMSFTTIPLENERFKKGVGLVSHSSEYLPVALSKSRITTSFPVAPGISYLTREKVNDSDSSDCNLN